MGGHHAGLPRQGQKDLKPPPSASRVRPSPYLPQPPAEGGLALFCFPWSGAGASAFSGWRADARQGHVAVSGIQLPGRERRIAEPPPATLDELLEELTPALAAHCGRPFALYGHSAGALFAYAAGAALERLGLLPTRLIVSGSRPPHRPLEHPPMHLLPEERLLEVVVEFGATPPALVAHPEIRTLILPALRADLRLAETYRVEEPRQLSCPVTAIAAHRDETVAVETMALWRDTTSGDFDLVTIPGGHFAALEPANGMPPLVAAAVARAAAEAPAS
jgi:medium-chain acyl-[acyl-carrier-protein] hydrolase